MNGKKFRILAAILAIPTVVVGSAVGLNLAKSPSSSLGAAAGPTKFSVITCVNSANVIESTRSGLTPQKCAHATDRRIVTEASWYVAPTATTTTSPTTTTAAPATTTTTTTPGCVGVPMLNGQSDIDASPPDTTFCLSGTHNWTLIPKTGDRLIGPAVLDGGNTTSWAVYVFNRDADNVTLADLEIRNYRAEAQRGAILASQNGESTGWTLRNLQVHDNGTALGGAGVTLGPGWQVLGGRYYNNRQEGMTGGGASGAVLDGVELDHNNFTDNTYAANTIDCGIEGGGLKWAATSSITIRNSKIHDNACRGLWADGSGNNSTITNNRVYDNWNEGIFIEISTGATITGNSVYGNGFKSNSGGGCPWLYGGGITISSSDRAEIANNSVVGNCNGITGLQQNRPDGTPGLLRDINVHDNAISGPSGRTGVVTDVGAALITRNIVFTRNTLTNGAIFCGFTC